MSSETSSPRDAVADVCSLPETSLEDRLGMIRREILPHLVSRRELPDGMRFSFADDPELRSKLDRLVELERECCSGLDFQVECAEGLHLSVRGIDPGSSFFAGLPGAAADAPGGLARLAKAGGLGFVASFFVLCVLPMGLAAVAGAAVAAPLAELESPLALAVGTLVAGVGAWWLLRRRAAARAGCGPGC